MAGDFPWYEVVSGPDLLQGDLIQDCPILTPTEVPTSEGTDLTAIRGEADVVVMTQSCDLIADKVNQVLLCPVWLVDEMKERHPHFRDKKLLNKIVQGHVVGVHMLAECGIDGHERQPRVVVLKESYTVPIDLLKQVAEAEGDRLRLRPPYREHLAQAFARFFMRVGLPQNIPKFA